MTEPTVIIHVPDRVQTFVKTLATGPQGAPGLAAIETDVTVDLTATGAADVYKAVSNNTSITAVVFRLSAVSGYSTAPRVWFRRQSDGKLFCSSHTLTGFNSVNEQYQFVFGPGVTPVLSAGDVFEIYVSTAASGTMTAKADVYGSIIGGSAYS